MVSVSFGTSFGSNLQAGYNKTVTAIGNGIQFAIGILQSTQSLIFTVLRSAAAMGSEVLTVVANVAAHALTITRTALIYAAKTIALSGAEISNLPIFLVPEMIMPNIYIHTVNSQTLHPNWFVLTYEPWKTHERRDRVLAHLGAAGENLSWDEYPYASTKEGGVRVGPNKTEVMAVPRSENSRQGGLLSVFYTWTINHGIYRSGTGTKFLVIPIPSI